MGTGGGRGGASTACLRPSTLRTTTAAALATPTPTPAPAAAFPCLSCLSLGQMSGIPLDAQTFALLVIALLCLLVGLLCLTIGCCCCGGSRSSSSYHKTSSNDDDDNEV